MIDRNSLELAADLASRSAQLPAVATCNWCEAAAEALCIARSRCSSVVRFATRNNGAAPGAPWPEVGVSIKPENPPLLEAIRSAAMQNPNKAPSTETRCPDLNQGCAVEAISLSQSSSSACSVLSVLTFVGARSVLRATASVDAHRGVDLCVVIAESAADGDSPFSDEDAEALRAAMRQITQRAKLAFAPTPGTSIEPLNAREAQVLDSLTHGKTIRQIASEMHRSTHTIHDYLKSMHRKVGVGNRAELIARSAGLCQPKVVTTHTSPGAPRDPVGAFDQSPV